MQFLLSCLWEVSVSLHFRSYLRPFCLLAGKKEAKTKAAASYLVSLTGGGSPVWQYVLIKLTCRPGTTHLATIYIDQVNLVVLTGGKFCPPEDIWKYLKTSVAVTHWRRVILSKGKEGKMERNDEEGSSWQGVAEEAGQARDIKCISNAVK